MMIKIAHVGGLGVFHHLGERSDILFCHAPLAAENDRYRSFFKAGHLGKYKILDLCAYELMMGTQNKSVSNKDYCEIAEDIGVDELVCPDIPGNPQESLNSSLSFIKHWNNVTWRKRPILMLVPHGLSIRQWLQNAENLLKEVNSARCTVGIPKIVFDVDEAYDDMKRIILGSLLLRKFKNIEIHLLGAGRNIKEEMVAIKETKPMIRSMDTTYVYRYLLSNSNPLQEYARPISLSYTKVPEDSNYKIDQLINLLKGENVSSH